MQIFKDSMIIALCVLITLILLPIAILGMGGIGFVGLFLIGPMVFFAGPFIISFMFFFGRPVIELLDGRKSYDEPASSSEILSLWPEWIRDLILPFFGWSIPILFVWGAIGEVFPISLIAALSPLVAWWIAFLVIVCSNKIMSLCDKMIISSPIIGFLLFWGFYLSFPSIFNF